MSILVDKNTRLLVQGMGKAGTFHAIQCREYGTNIVGTIALRTLSYFVSRATPTTSTS